MNQAPHGWMAKVRALPGKGWNGAMAPLKKLYQWLKDRYGPRYTQAMLVVAFIALFLPLPAGSLLAIALVAVIAEAHRGISRRGGLAETVADLAVVLKAHLPWWAARRWPSPPC